MRPKDWIKTIAAAAAMLLCWGFAPVAISMLKDSYSLVFQAFSRYALSMILLWSYQKISLPRREWRRCWSLVPSLLPWISLTALFTFAFQMMFTATYFRLSPGFGTLLYQNQVVFSLILGMLFFSEERKLLKHGGFYLGFLAVIFGAVLVIRSRFGGVQGRLDPGILLPLGAGLCWAFVGVTVKETFPHFPNGFSTALVFSIVAVLMFITLLFEPGPSVSGHPSPGSWILMLGMGFAGVGVGHTLFYYVLPRLGVVLTAGLQLLLPFIAGIVSFLIMGETVRPLQAAGGSSCWGVRSAASAEGEDLPRDPAPCGGLIRAVFPRQPSDLIEYFGYSIRLSPAQERPGEEVAKKNSHLLGADLFVKADGPQVVGDPFGEFIHLFAVYGAISLFVQPSAADGEGFVDLIGGNLDRMGEVEGGKLVAGGNLHRHIAVGHIFFAEARNFISEDQGHIALLDLKDPAGQFLGEEAEILPFLSPAAA